MQRFVVEQNIHHFEALLLVERNDAQRDVIRKLLAEEQEKLRSTVCDGPVGLLADERHEDSRP